VLVSLSTIFALSHLCRQAGAELPGGKAGSEPVFWPDQEIALMFSLDSPPNIAPTGAPIRLPGLKAGPLLLREAGQAVGCKRSGGIY
jgi:hypothetical protein